MTEIVKPVVEEPQEPRVVVDISEILLQLEIAREEYGLDWQNL